MTDEIKLVSIVVSTYNWPEALAVVLDSLSQQRDKRFEVIVADDGSTVETAEMVRGIAATFPVPLIHVWQEDEGFRAAAARNRAVAAAKGSYLVFLDGDCAVFPDFIGTHIRFAETGCFVAGNRILLSQSFTRLAFANEIKFYNWSTVEFIKARLCNLVNRILPLFKLPDGYFRKLRPRQWQGAKTCNLAVWRNDFCRINGFDEAFIGWGHEDAELVSRLINSGVSRKDGRFATGVLHLWHKEQARDDAAKNLQRLMSHMQGKLVRAEDGFDKY